MSRPAGRRATAFGLDIQSDVMPTLLAGCTAQPTGRALALSISRSTTEQLDWPQTAALVSDARQPDGSVIFQIEAHPHAGYLIHGPEYGAHLLSPDGSTLVCVPEAHPEHEWQRLLIAQVLPFAALLHGLEVFHASGVVHHGAAIALLGPSTSGKTSLALELCRLGADFLADDVLTLESATTELLAHPGTPIAGVNHGAEPPPEWQAGGGSASVVARNDRESLVRVRAAPRPAPLAALFFLDRRANGPKRPRFEPDPDPKLLLSATFNFVLDSPLRLSGLLDVCAAASHLHVERIVMGPGSSPADVAAAVEQRLGAVR